MWYSTLPEQPFCSRYHTFVLTNGTVEVDYTTTDVIVTVPAGATTGTVSVPTTADTIDEVDETSALHGTVSATGTIIDNNNAPTVATITPASATEGSDVFDFTLSNPSAVDTVYFFVTNGTAGSGLHDY
jgi:hypothetical protein